MQSRIERIKACLNGGRLRDEHPAVPVTPEESAVQAAAAVAAGAEALHLHPRGPGGAQSLRPDDVAAAVTAVRRACPGVPVGVTTGLWISDGDADRRLTTVAGWAALPSTARPDFASVNVGEPGFAELAEVLRRAEVGVEAGVWSTADAHMLAAVRTPVTRILVEVIDGSAASAVATADAILAALDDAGLSAPRLLHGEEATCWPLVAHAGRRGLPTRIGLEDTLVGPAGEPIADNADLVRRALTIWSAAVPPGGHEW
ncbi:3-keto-5-aminohexanoate cleavage protein [Actinoplanes sichuanensis]|uniref:3-keto-5-aminohexanoate cleavage protein n=1 Tax=Actinoplanes sichuanensis TaxID=512349 RepID=A0ABW4ARR8_9ACTN|nr:3-keto-5-aminohexanoate cleavage protein [Actinoplanes sichuanensis]BEL06304.1 3-keto-5-aminohexanoate cleavage protein [Actinoplanes sichuanensis]